MVIHLILKNPNMGTCGRVGGVNPSEKYEFVSWDYDIPN
jgi:hypothetical protein